MQDRHFYRAAYEPAPRYHSEPKSPATGRKPYQARVLEWVLACFGATIAIDRIERNHRFLEESLELVQSTGCTRDEAHELVEYVFDRPIGETVQEVGGVMNTLAALCNAVNVDLNEAAEIELARVWTKVEAIRAKQAAKPKFSAAPIAINRDVPELGSRWKHTNGNHYVVYDVTNADSDRQWKFPTTISYRGANGKKWSRPLRRWHASMTRLPDMGDPI